MYSVPTEIPVVLNVIVPPVPSDAAVYESVSGSNSGSSEVSPVRPRVASRGPPVVCATVIQVDASTASEAVTIWT